MGVALKKGDNLILSAFGGGFTWGAIWLKWAYGGEHEYTNIADEWTVDRLIHLSLMRGDHHLHWPLAFLPKTHP
jgi:hypothetical protein